MHTKQSPLFQTFIIKNVCTIPNTRKFKKTGTGHIYGIQNNFHTLNSKLEKQDLNMTQSMEVRKKITYLPLEGKTHPVVARPAIQNQQENKHILTISKKL